MGNLAIYIHWPYCARICPYCDFNVYKQRSDNDLIGAILDDLATWRDWSGPRNITSIHFGGGTPSLMRADDIRRVIETVQALWGLSSDCEIAIEANPHDANETHWRAYAKAGLNRLSLGVQSFHDPALKLLGRGHNAQQAKSALTIAKDIFPSVSLDLIFGWAGQTPALLKHDLETALSYAPDHISAYQLTIEAGTAFAKAEARGDIKAVGDDPSAELYELIRQRLIDEGYQHYEVSNFARGGEESKHNLTYWQGGDYVGVGPGAHGRLTIEGQRFATIAAMRPADYAAKVQETGLGLIEKDALSAEDWGDEYILMGLRITQGISLERYAEISGRSLPIQAINDLVDLGLVIQEKSTITVTPEGRLLLNTITEKLLT